MLRAAYLLPLFCAVLGAPLAADDPVVFRSDVSLVRVDAQVVDSSNRAIIHLHDTDFVLREDGRVVPIRNFASDNIPIDVLFLLDVSGSMRPHVQRIADASGQALAELGANDRMGIMVFDQYSRVRLAFNSNRQDVQREFDRLLRDERFNGGTDITRAMLDAADYIGSHGRRDARRAIVILTDDETNAQFDVDREGVGRALARADAVMCAIIAPAAAQSMRRRPGGFGGGGPGLGGPLGGIIFGPRNGGSPYPSGGGGGGGQDRPAETAEIARDSGGDSMSVNDASALDDTLERLRRRYTLYFSLPEGVQPGQERNIEVELAPDARRRFPDAQVLYRRAYTSPTDNRDRDSRPTLTRAPIDSGSSTPAAPAADSSTPSTPRRRVAVNEDGTAITTQGP
jgi:VWFA-related protein